MEPTDITTEQLMFSLIEGWQGSGKTQRNFCREKDIAYSKFHYWLKRYKEHTSLPDSRAGFAPVTLKDPIAGLTGTLELIYPDGRRLVFHQHVDPSFLRTLLG